MSFIQLCDCSPVLTTMDIKFQLIYEYYENFINRKIFGNFFSLAKPQQMEVMEDNSLVEILSINFINSQCH